MSKDIIDPNRKPMETVKNCNLKNFGGGFSSALTDTMAMLSHIMVADKKEPIKVEPDLIEDPVKKIEGEVEKEDENIIDAEFVDN